MIDPGFDDIFQKDNSIEQPSHFPYLTETVCILSCVAFCAAFLIFYFCCYPTNVKLNTHEGSKKSDTISNENKFTDKAINTDLNNNEISTVNISDLLDHTNTIFKTYDERQKNLAFIQEINGETYYIISKNTKYEKRLKADLKATDLVAYYKENNDK